MVWEKILAKDIPDIGLIQNIQIALKAQVRKQITHFKNEPKILIDTSPKEIYR